MATKTTGTNLYQASNQWMTRPDDQRFWTLEEAHTFCKKYADNAGEFAIDFNTARIISVEDNLAMDLPGLDKPAQFTNWGFDQMCRLAGAPSAYLRSLPPGVATACLESGLDRFYASQGDRKLERVALVHQNGTNVLRCVTSDKYTRFWNHQVFGQLIDLQSMGWKVPPGRPTSANSSNVRIATEADCLDVRMKGLGIKPGDPIGPSGIYSSDHDMFAFMVNEDVRLDDGSDGGLSRGFFVSNSEVGAGSLRLTLFHYRFVCGNHIVWDASDVIELNLRHVGDVGGKFVAEAQMVLGKYLKESAKVEQERIKRAQKMLLGNNAKEVLDQVFKAVIGNRKNGLPSGLNMKQLKEAYTVAEENVDTDGDPRSVWGYVNGLTRLSQATTYTDDRTFLDRAASNILAIAV
jgi:hypothetical protein